MEVKKYTNKNNHIIYFLVTDSGEIVKPVYEYMLFLCRNNYSKNTIQTICFNLKLYFEWLNLRNMTYIEAVSKKSDTNKGIIMNLSEFKMWLKYPDYNEKVIPMQEMNAVRTTCTVNNIMSCVCGFYNFLTANEDLDCLPVYREIRANPQFKGMISELLLKKENAKRSIFKEKAPKRIVKYINFEDYKKLLNAAANLRDKVIIGLLFDAGMRVSEVIGLHIEDFNEIHTNKIKIKKREDFNNPDSAVKYDSTGIVFVSDEIKNLIIDYINSYLSYTDTNYFIFNNYGEYKFQPMRRSTIEKMIRNLGKKCGIKNLTPHMLRHGCAVFMLKNGATMRQIQDKLRHKSPVTTASVYADLDDEDRKKAMSTVYGKVNEKFTPESLSMDDLADWLLEEDDE